MTFCFCNGQNKGSGINQYKTSCLGSELDGSLTVVSWGFGRNRLDAIEQAKKNAVRDVIFNGIRDGVQSCELKPLIPEVNAQSKYEQYFFEFFKDGGDFKKFASSKDERIYDRFVKSRKVSDGGVSYSKVIRILREDLKRKFIEDGILKNNDISK